MSQNDRIDDRQILDRVMMETAGSFYLFDIAKLKERVRYLNSCLPESVMLCYAVKANPFIVRELKDELERFEICSPGEAGICTTSGVDSKKMVISGVYKTPDVIEKMVADQEFRGIFTAESLNQYELLCALSEKYSRSIEVLPRLTNGSQFGMNDADIESIVAGREEHPYIELRGIQFFSGTQKTSLKKYRRELEHLDSLLTLLKEKYGFEAEELEYGTGFPVTYFEGEELDEEALLEGFSGLLDSMVNRPRIVLEIGRSIAASCGKYFTHVVDIKRNKGQNYLLVDGGMHQLVYFGQYMAMKQPFMSVVGKTEGVIQDSSWTICGSLCTMNDIIAKQVDLPEVKMGDTLCFENTGAYCMIEGISLFLSRDIPAVYLLLEDGELVCVRKTFETEALNTPYYERNY